MENSFETRLLNVTKRKFHQGNDTDDHIPEDKPSSTMDTKPSSTEDKKPSASNISANSDDGDTEDRKPSAARLADSSEGGASSSSSSTAPVENHTIVGHLRRDKMSSTVDEFDELFGI